MAGVLRVHLEAYDEEDVVHDGDDDDDLDDDDDHPDAPESKRHKGVS